MHDSRFAALQEVSGVLDTAIRLASEGRYAELNTHSAAVGEVVGRLEQLRQMIGQDASSGDGLRESCKGIKRKVLTFSEVMRHATMVQAGLLQIESSAGDSYNHRGCFAAGQAGSRGRRFVNEKA